MIQVSVQPTDFDIEKCYQWLRQAAGTGAIVSFSGLVRDMHNERRIESLYLEHYPEMTLPALRQLAEQAKRRFSLNAIMLIHRVGHILANEQIVYVGCATQHRKDAFDATMFVMDRLKTDVPLWKKENYQSGESDWVSMKGSDKQAASKW
ncbi:molybdenum cofactor biosynthesis protein MoaE [Alteromonas facilis]|uniref:molybdenum cofactor biosynthesis protein MoaE n=1 Tax=Alteromonas facilis TaxID=2048004 RepID=UPI001F0BEAEB|nr:molybdenum cofactor biosynthesis protein MoaE [Alteromonas facilis]